MAKVSSRFQIVIPEKVRKALNLKSGTQVDLIVKGRVAYLVSVVPISNLKLGTKLLNNNFVREKGVRNIIG